MKLYLGIALLGWCVAACYAAIGPTIISREPDEIDLDVDNTLSVNDGAENLGLCNLFPGAEEEKSIDPDIDEDSKLRVPELIRKYKYNSEFHDVTTPDGYILQMHRIIASPVSPLKKGKPAVLLMHGLLDSSSTWVVMRPNHGFAYMLADQGYDVWLGNARGNTYSRRHVKYNPDGSRSDREKFWSFSWHEIGAIDLPTMIDYVLEKTEQSKLQYIGHSQGTTAFFVMCSVRPEYNDKIIMMNAMAPVAYTKHIRSPIIRALSPFVFMIDRLTSLIGLHEFLPSCELFIMGGKAACKDQAITQKMCENILILIAGYSSNELNATMLPIILAHTPAGASAGQLAHYGQEAESGHFRQYDHGWIDNYFVYDRFTPPNYDLANVKAKVAIYYSESDTMADERDVRRLIDELPNVVGTTYIPRRFNHLDFIWGYSAPALVYQPIMKAMKQSEQ